jgi:hypothetical protein
MDEITELNGVFYSLLEYYEGCNQIGIVPEGLDRDGNPLKMVYLDEARVTKQQGNYAALERTSVDGPAAKIRLGCKAHDKLTGFAGFVVMKRTNLHGPADIALDPCELDPTSGNPRDAVMFREGSIVVDD